MKKRIEMNQRDELERNVYDLVNDIYEILMPSPNAITREEAEMKMRTAAKLIQAEQKRYVSELLGDDEEVNQNSSNPAESIEPMFRNEVRAELRRKAGISQPNPDGEQL